MRRTAAGTPSRRDPAAGLVVAAALAVLLAAAWLLPVLAPVGVWPLLFGVPGWALIAWSRPRISATGRLGLAIVLSAAISAHLVHWLSLATGGYRRETIFLAAALLAAPLPLAAWWSGRAILARQATAAASAVRRNAIPFVLASLVSAFVGIVLALSLWQLTPGGGISAGGSNWSDLPVHLSIAQSLNAGNFPPQVPYFAGAPLTYHWFADFHAAIAARAAGTFAIPAFIAGSAILSGSLALTVHGLARQLLSGRGARRAALLAMILVTLGGGLGWIRLVGDVTSGLGDPLTLVAGNSYDNSWFDARHHVSWPYFRIPSVMGTGLLVHRATTFGLPMLAGAVLLLVAGLPSGRARAAGARDRPVLIGLSGLLGALLAPVHFFFFPAVPLLALLYVTLAGRLIDRPAPRHAVLFLAPYALALPFAVPALLQAGASGALRFVFGWESAPSQDGVAGLAFFYVTNLGIPFVLAIAALLAPRTPWRAFLGAWALALFLIPNLLQASDIGFDMNKYFQAMWIAVVILAAWLIRHWPLPAVALVVALSVPSPLLVAGWTVLGQEQMLGPAEVAAAGWIPEHTEPGSVFATDGWLHSPTDPAGRLRLLTYEPYVRNLGISTDQRVGEVHDIYCGGAPEASIAIMRRLGATYLIDAGRPAACHVPTDFSQSPHLALVFESQGLRIWRLTDAAASLAPGSGVAGSGVAGFRVAGSRVAGSVSSSR
jgi:hypothetical protein